MRGRGPAPSLGPLGLAFMTRKDLLALFSSAGLLLACDPMNPVDAGMDASTDAGGAELDADRDTGPRTPGLPVLRAAEARSTAAFCACLPMRDPARTEAQCLESNGPDPEVDACEDRATALVGTAFDAFYLCRAAAFRALADCYAATCSMAAVTACNGDFQTANTACRGRLPALSSVQTYLTEYEACIVERVTGAMGACPDDASATSSAVGPAVFSGSTALAGNDSEPFLDCFATPMSMMNAVGAPDRSFRWIAPAAGSYRIDTVGSDFDTILYVRSACTDMVDLLCSDDIVLGVNQASCAVLDVALGEELVVIVDGFGELVRGDFTVNITADASCPVPDAGVPDAGLSDAGLGDAGLSDAGLSDAGLSDAGLSDAGLSDAP